MQNSKKLANVSKVTRTAVRIILKDLTCESKAGTSVVKPGMAMSIWSAVSLAKRTDCWFLATSLQKRAQGSGLCT